MDRQSLQQAARAAFSLQDWALLACDYGLSQTFAQLSRVEDVENFVFDGYDRLRHLRECGVALSVRENDSRDRREPFSG